MINLNNYIERIIGMYLQYRFATEAMDRLHADDWGLSKYIEWETDFVSEFLKNLSSIPGIVKSKYRTDLQKLSEYWKEKLTENIGKAYLPNKQNFIIISFATFESFLKDIHREILFKEPKLLNPDKKIELGRLAAAGYDKIIEEEIENKVQSLDRKSIQDRAKYFKEHLGIPWSEDPDLINQVSDLNDLRNRILHENPDEEVSEETIESSLFLLIVIPSTLYICSRQKYIGVFQDIF